MKYINYIDDINKDEIFYEVKNNFTIFVKKNKKKIFFLKTNKKLTKKKTKKIFFLFYNYFNFLMLNLKINLKNNFFIFKNKIFYISNEDQNIVVCCYTCNFFLKYFILIKYNNEINFCKKFFLNNENNFFFFKKNFVLNLNIFNKKNFFYKTNFIFLKLNFKIKKRKILFYLKIKTNITIFNFNNIFFIKKSKNNLFLKLKIFLRFGKNFNSYVNFDNFKKKIFNKTIINYCLLNKFILIKKEDIFLEKEKYNKNLYFN